MSEILSSSRATTSDPHSPLLIDVVRDAEAQLESAKVSFGHGTTNAFDEAAWLVLWSLGLPLDTPIGDPKDEPQSVANRRLTPAECAEAASILGARIRTRKPTAYLTKEAWLQGVSFYVDERVIVPRSLIAELVVHGGFDYWLHPQTSRVLDLCTGNGSLAILVAMVFPEVTVIASDLSKDALAVASINVNKHQLSDRIALVESDGLASTELHKDGPYQLILCNPPYVCADSMATLPPEYLAEPLMALDGNTSGNRDGMDFVRSLLTQAPHHLDPLGVLVLEIGNERAHFEAAFPNLDPVWLNTSAGDDQVLLLTREALLK